MELNRFQSKMPRIDWEDDSEVEDSCTLLDPALTRDEAWNCFYALTQYIALQGYPLELHFDRFWQYVQQERDS